MPGFLDSLGGFASGFEDVFETVGDLAQDFGRIRSGLGAQGAPTYLLQAGGAYSGAATLPQIQGPTNSGKPLSPGFTMNSTWLLIIGALVIIYFLFIK